MAAAAFHGLASGTAPAAPASPEVRAYADSNKRLCTVDDTPTTRVLVDRDSVETLTNKKFDDTCTIVDNVDATKVWALSLGGMTTAVTLTLSSTQSTSQTLSIPNITGADILMVCGLAQSVTGVKTMTNPTCAAGSITVPSMTLTAGTLMTTPTAGVVEFDGTAFYRTSDVTNGRAFDDRWSYFRLTGSGTGITAIADFFGANSGIPLVANGVYEIEWFCQFSQATAGATTWTITTATTALANLSAHYIASPIGGIGAVGTPQVAGVNTTASSATALPATGVTGTGATHHHIIKAILTAGNGTSNVRLRATAGAGTITPLINSFFRVRRLPAANTGTFVA